MAILIIGGTGFIGARLAERLINQGEEVVCFDLYPNYEAVKHLGDHARVIVGDVTRLDDVMGAIKTYKVAKIINLAALLVAESEAYLLRALRLNLMGMVNVFEAARLNDISRVVYASSIAAYGLQDSYGERPLSEDDVCQPTLAYGAHKLWTDFMAKKYIDQHGMSIAGLRIAIVSGPGRKTGISAWSSTYVDNPAVGEPVEIPYRSNQKVAITYVDETAETFLRLCLADKLNHQIYNSFGYSVTLNELAETVKSFLPEAQIRFTEDASDMPLVYEWSSERLEKEFDWTAPPLPDMVRKHINTVREKAGLPAVRQAAQLSVKGLC